LNIFAKFGLAFGMQSLAMGLALQTSARATVGDALTLKPAVQVATDEVTLRDLVVNDSVSYENIVICHAPTIGSVRTVTMAEMAIILQKSGEVHPLRGPDQISITRVGRKISAADLKPLIESELKSRDGKGTIKDIQLQAAIFVTDVSGLKLRTLRFDSAINKYRAWFVTSGAPHAVSFEAMATLEVRHDGTGARNKVQLPPLSPLLEHRGETAAMQLDGEGFSATLMVVCLEDGKASGTIRVREQISKRNYRAQIISAGLLRAVSREN
jgi:hypothetical protein